ncbi:MAG TPA: response regulator, partial [Anaeromyxobacteraceae bacterium]|nr:response regulator [Anaeromyxobacteraceae bacterium]
AELRAVPSAPAEAPPPKAAPTPPVEDDWSDVALDEPGASALAAQRRPAPVAVVPPEPEPPRLIDLEESTLAPEVEPIQELDMVEEAPALAPPPPAPAPAADRAVRPPAAEAAARAPTAAPAPAPVPEDGGEAQLRQALSQASREVIEKIAWEVVPQLAETIIREHVDRLVSERQSR